MSSITNRTPPAKSPQGQTRQNNFLEAVIDYTANNLLSAFTDTLKVTLQRIAILHMESARVANSMFSELTGPGHTIAGATASSISTAKNDITRLVTQVKILLEAYKSEEGRRYFTDADNLMTDYEFVMHYLRLIDDHLEEFRELAERIGAEKKLWKNQNEKSNFMALFKMDLEAKTPLEQEILLDLILAYKRDQGMPIETGKPLDEFILENLYFIKRDQKALKSLGMKIAREKLWFTKEDEKKAFLNFLDNVLDIKRIEEEIKRQNELKEIQLTLVDYYLKNYAHQRIEPVSDTNSLINKKKDVFKNIASDLGVLKKWWKNEDQKKVFMLLFEPNITKILKQIKAVYFHSLFKSICWTLPVSILIATMPYILNSAGNPVLMSEKWIAGIFAIAPLFTVLNSMNSSMIAIFAPYLQYRLTGVSVLLRDIPQVTCSLLGWHYQSPYLIATGQAVPAGVSGALGTYMILKELNKNQTHLPLTTSQESGINQRINRNIMGVIATSGFRFLIPLILGLLKQHLALLVYNIYYTQTFGLLGLPRSVSQTYTFGRGQHAYDGNEKTLDRCLGWSNTLLTVFLALTEFSIRDRMIDWINAPSTPEAIEANNFSHKYWLIGCLTMSLLGLSYVQQDKIGNAYDHRVLLAAINLLPQVIGFFAPIYWGGNAQIIGISIGWLLSAVLSITVGLCWNKLTGPTPQPLAQGRNNQHFKPNQPLTEATQGYYQLLTTTDNDDDDRKCDEEQKDQRAFNAHVFNGYRRVPENDQNNQNDQKV